MGFKGLWRCLNEIAQQVDLECLRGKVIAIDTFNLLYRYEFMEGMDGEEAVPSNHCHVRGLFDTICILLSFGIRPIFVFDGAPSELKKLAIERRNLAKQKNRQAVDGEQDVIKARENEREKIWRKSREQNHDQNPTESSSHAHDSSNKEALHRKNTRKCALGESIEDSSKPCKGGSSTCFS
ncbi:uncharacterized protein LOC141850491 [Brevipalpus obovatus]|uniref:uncharacterized protein LOC141850491 n=1 Tax=Brevipalpus obovatus TaxID=246614 RepID=UPI003D9DF107